MIIELNNIGPVKHMELDLSKQLITFMGLNGTGKTYISYVIYSLLRGFNTSFNLLKNTEKINEDTLKGTLDIDAIYDFVNEQMDLVTKQLPQIFNISSDNDQFKNSSIQLLSTKDSLKESIFNTQQAFNVIDLFRFQKKSGELTFSIQKLNMAEFDKEDPNDISLFIMKMLVYGSPTANMLTAERSGVYTFSRELSINRFKQSSYSPTTFQTQRYPRPIVNSIIEADDLAQTKKNKALTTILATRIESDILSGRMLISSDGELRYKAKKMKQDLAFTLTSSAVKTIAPIIIFLKHQAIYNQSLIIDEPELNLHPKNQILLARVFARIINAGIRLIINTHSDYILRELNSLIMLNAIDDTTRKKLKYAEDERIDYRKVGVYEFNLENISDHGVVVKEVPVSKTGFDSVLIDEVINKQMNTSQEIYLALGDLEELIEEQNG